MGHARALLTCRSQKAQRALAGRVERDGLSVRDVEKLAAAKPKSKRQEGKKTKSRSVRELEAKVEQKLGMKVSIAAKDANVGQVVIRYKSLDELDRLLEKLGVK